MFRDLALKSVIQLVRWKFPQVRSLSTSQLAQWLEASPRLLLLDARNLDEFNASHLPQAQHIDPKTPNWGTLANYPQDDPIVVYCSVGYRSSQVAEKLQEQGFSNVWNLAGSIFQWANEARSLYNSEGELTTQVHPYNDQWGKLLKPEHRYERIGKASIDAPK